MAMASSFFLVAAGGALGACARFAASLGLAGLTGAAFPWPTLVINLVGSGLMGVLAGIAAADSGWRLFLGVGVLGGFTTFSAFSIETVRLIEQGEAWAAALYAGLSAAGCAAAAALGLTLVRGLS